MTKLQDSITFRIPSPDEHQTHSQGQHQNPRHVLIYFIPGNPGLIEFYRPFLKHLASTLEPTARRTGASFTITGNSLANFNINSASRCDQHPLNLKQMITHAENALTLAASPPSTTPSRPTEVILIGHSVGAYIMMCILSSHLHPPYNSRSHSNPNNRLNITAGIGLFPTIVDLYLSPSGRKASWMAQLPALSLLLHTIAKLLTALLPSSTLLNLIQTITAQPQAAATVTANFLASPRGVRQAIYLAQHELLDMRQDRWSDAVWTTTASQGRGEEKQHALFFFFGADDHWIENRTRDQIIAARRRRAEGEPGPKIEIDGSGLPHDFCVREDWSRTVAGKVGEYVGEVLGVDG